MYPEYSGVLVLVWCHNIIIVVDITESQEVRIRLYSEVPDTTSSRVVVAVLENRILLLVQVEINQHKEHDRMTRTCVNNQQKHDNPKNKKGRLRCTPYVETSYMQQSR
jgi:hypothetical protein